MSKPRNRFEYFCYRHRNWGIPNLMLYISLGSAIVYLISTISRDYTLYNALDFNRTLILQGQVWRLFSYVFTYSGGNLFFTAISLFCYYSLGRAVENSWGTFRFNLFYLTGIILLDAFAMIFGTVYVDGYPIPVPDSVYSGMIMYLNLSLFIAYATLYPNSQFLILFIIPVKAWIFALFDLVVTLINVVELSYPIMLFPLNLFPLVALANYFLFFGKDVGNLIPMSWKVNSRRLFRKKPKNGVKPIPFPSAGSYQATVAQPKAPYTHRCTICGKTDISNPEMDFRYCSRCNGYYCYCEEHISNHTHVQ